MWTVDLCEMDSDGDGRTNGVELCDPNCEWQPGRDDVLQERCSVSHPGLPADYCYNNRNIET